MIILIAGLEQKQEADYPTELKGNIRFNLEGKGLLLLKLNI